MTSSVPVAAGAAGSRIGAAAALIAGLTVASRLAGLVRIVVFVAVVGYTDLGTIYQTANTVPNIIYEIVAGGALAGLVVPVLAAPIARRDVAEVGRTASVMLTWALLVLVPIAVLVAVFADPLVSALSSGATPEMAAMGARMLRVFAPQLPLYGIGVVLTGVLQAHRRFAWPAVAPLLSSVVVIASYGLYGAMGEPSGLAGVSRSGELVLSVGTTLGVVVLSGCLVVPVLRTGVRLRPALSFTGAGVGRVVRGLAVTGAVTVGMQQLAMGVVIYLANPPAPEGALVTYTAAMTLYLLPWAVLAVPAATAAYPALAEAVATGRSGRYAEVLAGTVRGVLLLSGLGVAGLVVLAGPLAELLSFGDADAGQVRVGVLGFAPGLFGYALFAVLSRALYARGDTVRAAAATALGWGVAMGAAIVLSAVLPRADRVAALTVGNSAGMVVLGVALLTVVAVRAGGGALAGAWRAGGAALAAAVAASAAGLSVVAWCGGWPAAVAGVLGGAVALVVYGAVAVLLDRSGVRPLLERVVRRVRRG